jgi:hypothetical protein
MIAGRATSHEWFPWLMQAAGVISGEFYSHFSPKADLLEPSSKQASVF